MWDMLLIIWEFARNIGQLLKGRVGNSLSTHHRFRLILITFVDNLKVPLERSGKAVLLLNPEEFVVGLNKLMSAHPYNELEVIGNVLPKLRFAV